MKSLYFILLLTSLAHADSPNAFHPNQIASGAVATGIDGCLEGLEEGHAKLGMAARQIYCSCVTDWMEEHPQESQKGSTPPGLSILQQCLKFAGTTTDIKKLTNAFNPKKLSSLQVWNFMNGCQGTLDKKFKRIPAIKDPIRASLWMCSCHEDYWRDHPTVLGKPIPNDINHQCTEWTWSHIPAK